MMKGMKIGLAILISTLLIACSPLQQGERAFRGQNYEEAYQDLLPLAKKGNAQAQYAVGYLYYNGFGVKRDFDTALYWFRLAALQKEPHAIEALKQIKAAEESNPFPAPFQVAEKQPGQAG